MEKYWEAGLSSVCMTCYSIGHNQIKNCEDQLLKCIIYAGPYKVEDHCYKVAGCNKRKNIIHVYITAKYVNCGKTHIANFLHCVSQHKVDIIARKIK